VTNTATYSACVLNEIPRHDRDVWILWMMMRMEAKCDKSPSNLKIFMAIFSAPNVAEFVQSVQQRAVSTTNTHAKIDVSIWLIT